MTGLNGPIPLEMSFSCREETVLGFRLAVVLKINLCMCCPNDAWAALIGMIADIIVAIATVMGLILSGWWGAFYLFVPKNPTCNSLTGTLILNVSGVGPPFYSDLIPGCC